MASHIRQDLRSMEFPTNMSFSMKLNDLKKQGKKIINLSFGISPFAPPKCLLDALKGVDQHDYVGPNGIEELRVQISRLHERTEGSGFDPNRLVVANGVKQLLFLILRVFDGEVYLPTPAWPAYLLICNIAGEKPILVPTTAEDRWLVTPSLMEQVIAEHGSPEKNKIFILTNPGNPSGTCYKESDLAALTAVWRKHKMLVISDEIYSFLHFKNDILPTRKVYPEGTITANGFSKWASVGGWRMGYAHFPPELDHFGLPLMNVAVGTYTCAATPFQYAMAKALEECPDEMEAYARDTRNILGKIARFCEKELGEVGLSFIPSEAGYYIMPDFEPCRAGLAELGGEPGDAMSDTFVHTYGVGLMSAKYFARPNTELFTRLCFNSFDGEPFLNALQERDAGKPGGVECTDDDIRKFCPDLVLGLEKIKDFVKKYA